jgi:hypothetical protein
MSSDATSPLRVGTHGCRIAALAALFAVCAAPALAANGDAKFDVLYAKNGKSYQGAVVDETPAEVRFQIVQRKAGRPTVVFQVSFPRGDIKKLDKLAGKEREELLSRIAAIHPVEEMAGLLKPAVFVADKKKGRTVTRGLNYDSDAFSLASNANEEIVRRAAVRMEQIYAAYAFYLPPVARPAKLNSITTIYLVQSAAEYENMLKRDVFNPAVYYDTGGQNEIVAGSELEEFGKRLAEVRRGHAELLERTKKQEAEVNKLPKGEVQKRAREQLQQARQEIAEANQRNEELFRQSTRLLFRTLYHEAFHAYLANFAFPPSRGEVPRWLNEGLAQVFEEAYGDGELQVGRIEPARLEKAQATDLVPLADLVKSTPAQFVVAHGQERQAADRYYLTSWALAHYLMFERRVIGTPALEDYLTALNGRPDAKNGARERGDPAEALAKLAGRPLPDLDKELKQYLTRLQPDGSTKK